MTPASHEEIAELLGAYALDAVDGDERALVEDHLRGCPRCREEVRQHRDVAAHLAFAGEAAPAGLWERIAADLGPVPAPPDVARLYPIGRRSAAPPWMVRTMAAAAAVIVVVAGAFGWAVHRQDDRVAQLRGAVASTGLQGAALGALVDPRATRFELTSAGGRVHIAGVIEPDGSGYLVPAGGGALPALPASETYQLWGISGASAVSLGVLGNHPGVVSFEASGTRVAELAITAEQAGGVLRPTRAPVAAGVLA